jgi:pimeloyl-ACP methyl ester carboxylesterase
LARRKPRRRFAGALLTCGFVFSGCAAHVPQALPDVLVGLNGHTLRLHLANAGAPASQPLLVFVSGDGGMHRKDLDAYRHLASWGYPTAGFDARDYVTHLGTESNTTTPDRLAADYARIIDTARRTLRLAADHPVVLVGVSRGAGLSVVAAPHLRPAVEGVVVVALTREEEYVRWYRRLPLLREPRAVMVNVYEYLSQLGDLPLAVIQSTRDHYLPAAAARALFGPDSTRRHFEAIDARNHSFAGARTRLYSAMRSALEWVESAIPSR